MMAGKQEPPSADAGGLYGTLASWGGSAWSYAASTVNRQVIAICRYSLPL